MGTDADFKLDRLMAKASDFQGKHDVDEARDGKVIVKRRRPSILVQGGASTKRHRVDDGRIFRQGTGVYQLQERLAHIGVLFRSRRWSSAPESRRAQEMA
jgi:hypothetical protein